ncbi:MAG: molybdenum cofactor guanylyltransferase [Acidobacteria bacterium]|nr:molybdenum cofactor guanylyltransferase [Acidobacteriota bacterium]
MTVAGFILAGGQSTRMGRDKALLPVGGEPMARRVADALTCVAEPVTLVGPKQVYGFLGLPVVEDRNLGCGPLSGIVEALETSTSEWNLIVACDMPDLDAAFLRRLTAEASQDWDAVLPVGASGRPEPLCALYHRRCLPVLSASLAACMYKVTAALTSLRVRRLPVEDDRSFRNVNTPEDWQRILQERGLAPKP